MIRRLIVLLAIAIVAVSAAACGSSTGDLTGKTWQWNAATTKAPASQSVVPNPENYTIMFNTDGSYNAKADCNQVNGAYTTNGSSITIKPGAATMMACADGSLDAMYVAGLGSATTWAVASGNLTLTNAAGDTMTFAKGS